MSKETEEGSLFLVLLAFGCSLGFTYLTQPDKRCEGFNLVVCIRVTSDAAIFTKPRLKIISNLSHIIERVPGVRSSRVTLSHERMCVCEQPPSGAAAVNKFERTLL